MHNEQSYITNDTIRKISSYVYKCYARYLDDPDDMVLEMTLVCHMAEQSYEKDKGASLNTWCWYKIKMSSMDYLRKHGRLYQRGKVQRPSMTYPDQMVVDKGIGWDVLGEKLSTCNILTIDERILHNCLSKITIREQMVIRLRDFYGFTMKEIAKVFSVGESRVSQIRTEALGRMRKIMEETND